MLQLSNHCHWHGWDSEHLRDPAGNLNLQGVWFGFKHGSLTGQRKGGSCSSALALSPTLRAAVATAPSSKPGNNVLRNLTSISPLFPLSPSLSSPIYVWRPGHELEHPDTFTMGPLIVTQFGWTGEEGMPNMPFRQNKKQNKKTSAANGCVLIKHISPTVRQGRCTAALH